MWRNFSFPCMTIVGKLKISPNVAKFQMSPHNRCGEIRNSPHMAYVWCRIVRHIGKIYAIFMCRNIEPKSTFVEKKMTNIRSGQHQILYHRTMFFSWYSLLKLIVNGQVPHWVLGISIYRNTSQIRDISVVTQMYKITWATNIWMWRAQKYFVSTISCTSRCSTALVESETVSLSKVAIRVIPAYCTTTNLIHVPKYQKYTQNYQIPSE